MSFLADSPRRREQVFEEPGDVLIGRVASDAGENAVFVGACRCLSMPVREIHARHGFDVKSIREDPGSPTFQSRTSVSRRVGSFIVLSNPPE